MHTKQETNWKMIDTNRIHRRTADKELNQRLIFHSQHKMLMHLSDLPGISHKQLAKSLVITPAAAAVTLKKLESGVYITRTPKGKDNRFNQVTITAKGEEGIEKSRRLFELIETTTFDGFSQEEIELFYGFLERISSNMLALEERLKK